MKTPNPPSLDMIEIVGMYTWEALVSAWIVCYTLNTYRTDQFDMTRSSKIVFW